jgi:predicted Ser/Thr protein kinase
MYASQLLIIILIIDFNSGLVKKKSKLSTQLVALIRIIAFSSFWQLEKGTHHEANFTKSLIIWNTSYLIINSNY